MTAKEFKKAREQLNLDKGQMAELLKVDLRTVRRYENDHMPIKPVVALAIKLLLAVQGTKIGKEFGV